MELIKDTAFKANVLKELGNVYQLYGKSDSALYYYNSSLETNPNLTNKLDLEKNIALLLFEKGEKDSAYILIKNNLDKIDYYKPKDSYYGILGKMYYDDKIYDTAIYYLKLSLDNTNYKHTIINSSNYMSLIYGFMENDEMKDYYDSISLQALYEINNSSVNRNRIQYIYKDYCDRKRKNTQMEMRRSNTKYLLWQLL